MPEFDYDAALTTPSFTGKVALYPLSSWTTQVWVHADELWCYIGDFEIPSSAPERLSADEPLDFQSPFELPAFKDPRDSGIQRLLCVAAEFYQQKPERFLAGGRTQPPRGSKLWKPGH